MTRVSTLTVATLNLENGRELDLLPQLVSQVPGIDILFFQEARAFDFDGQKLRFRAEELLTPLGLDRSVLTRSTRGLLHEMIFVRSARLRPLRHFTPDLPDVFHDQAGVGAGAGGGAGAAAVAAVGAVGVLERGRAAG